MKRMNYGHEMGWTARALACLCVAVLSSSVVVKAASLEEEAAPLANGGLQGHVTFSVNPDNTVTTTFHPLPGGAAVGTANYGTARADASVATGAFVGDYPAAAVKALSFSLKSGGTTPGYPMVVLKSDTGGEWVNYRLRVSDEAGEWILNYIPMQRSAGWQRNRGAGDWDADISGISEISLRLSRSTVGLETYSIDNFMLVGDGFITSLQEALLAKFNALSTSEVDPDAAANDPDGDGAGDLAETVWGTDADTATDTPLVEIVSVTEAGVTIKWPVSAGSPYKVYRASGVLESGDDFAVIDAAVAASSEDVARGYTLFTDGGATDGQPYFYKVARIIEE